jgi:hypothetical protein
MTKKMECHRQSSFRQGPSSSLGEWKRKEGMMS